MPRSISMPLPVASRPPRYPYDVTVVRHENEGFGFVIISSVNKNGSTIGQFIILITTLLLSPFFYHAHLSLSFSSVSFTSGLECVVSGFLSDNYHSIPHYPGYPLVGTPVSSSVLYRIVLPCMSPHAHLSYQ